MSHRIVPDPQLRWRCVSFRADLTPATVGMACPLLNGKYRIDPPAGWRVGEGQVFVVHGLAYWAQQRLDPGALVTERLRLIDPRDAHGAFSFEPCIGGAPAFPAELSLAPASTAATGNNSDRKSGGITAFTDNPAPILETAKLAPPMFALNNAAEFHVLFSLISDPAAPGVALPTKWAVGAAAVPPMQRVDFAGVDIIGRVMDKNYFDRAVAKLH